jgi:hypothetical protein
VDREVLWDPLIRTFTLLSPLSVPHGFPLLRFFSNLSVDLCPSLYLSVSVGLCEWSSKLVSLSLDTDSLPV